MRCVHPLDVRIKVDGKPTNSFRSVPCGTCYACLFNKQQDWVVRMLHEQSVSQCSYFVTLTYEPGFEPITSENHMTLSKNDFQLFMKRFRKNLSCKCRFFMCGEYGPQTLRPHYHFVGFFDKFLSKEEISNLIDISWSKGFICVEDSTSRSMAYVAKYVLKGSKFYEDCEKPFVLMSRNPGLGHSYCEDERFDVYHLVHPYMVENGYKKRLPRYYINQFGISEYGNNKHFEFKDIVDSYLEKFPNLSYSEIYQTILQNEKNRQIRSFKKLKL